MDNQIIVSVCIVVYNHEKYISQALESVLEQKTDFQFEIIIGDDCSTDNSQEIIKRYAEKYPNIVPVLREKNVGATKNGWDLFLRAQGKYISWLDGDDFWIDDNKIQKQVDFLRQHPEYYAVGSRSKIVDENNNNLPCKHYDSDEVITPYNYNRIGMPNIGSLLFVNFINNDNTDKLYKLFCSHRMIMDWTLYLYILDHSAIYIINPPMHCYRKVLNKKADNFSSIYRLQRNRYDVIVERMEYEQALNIFDWKRMNVNYSVQKKAAELWLQYLLDDNKESRAYGKSVYKNKLKKHMSLRERMALPYRFLKLVKYHIIVKIEQLRIKNANKQEK